MRLVVTGGCGFVGSALVRAAVERGDMVLNIDRRRKTTEIPALAPIAGRDNHVRLEANLADRALTRAVIREFRPDALVHLCAADHDDPSQMFDSEPGAAFSVLEAVRDLLPRLDTATRDRFRLVHAVQAGGEAERAAVPAPADSLRRAAEKLIWEWSHAHGLPLVTCVADAAFGPHQGAGAFLPRLVAALLSGEGLRVSPSNLEPRDFIGVRDFASGLLRAATAAPPGSAWEFSVGAERREVDLAETVCGLLDERLPRAAGPWGSLVRGEEAAARQRRPGVGPSLDPRPAERELGWTPAGFHAALRETLAWVLASAAPLAGQAKRAAG